jgi:hypothetical protein
MTKDFKPFDWAILCFVAFLLLGALLHLAFGMSNVVSAFASEKAAAWVQAIGAIAAIGIAIWVANRTERSSERNAEVAAKHFVKMAEAAIGGLYVAVRVRPSEESDVQKARFIGELREVQHIGQGIQLGQLKSHLCADVLETRLQVGRCMQLEPAINKYPMIYTNLEHALRAPSRDGYTIAYALLKSSWESMKEINARVNSI